jgi:hypothetical protein
MQLHVCVKNKFDFKRKYTDDENSPVQALLEIPVETKPELIEETKVHLPEIDIYDQTAIFVAPMHVLQTKTFRSLTLKINLPDLITHGVDACRTQLSLLNRQFNKSLFLSNLRLLLHTRKLNLSSISKIFMKIQTVYKQAQIERDSIRKQKGPTTENCFKKDTFTSDQF